MVAADPGLLAARPGQTLIGDKNYHGRDFEAAIAEAGITLLRPARKGEPARAGQGGDPRTIVTRERASPRWQRPPRCPGLQPRGSGPP
jgi:hypothetical protein